VVGKDTLQFRIDGKTNTLTDQLNNSWAWSGNCVDGSLKNSKLDFVQAYQEYWHSWKTFHPQTKKYKP